MTKRHNPFPFKPQSAAGKEALRGLTASQRAKPMRPITEPRYADEKAIEYAEFLLRRDGVSIDALHKALCDADAILYPHTVTKHRRRGHEWTSTIAHPNAMPPFENGRFVKVVRDFPSWAEYRPRADRPRFVVWYVWRNYTGAVRLESHRVEIYRLELPNWDFRPEASEDGPEAEAA